MAYDHISGKRKVKFRLSLRHMMTPQRLAGSRKITVFLLLLVLFLVYALITSHDADRVLRESHLPLLSFPRTLNASNVAPHWGEQTERLFRIDQVCKSVNVPGTVRTLLAYMPRNVTFCPAFKAASTYWIQMFRFLHGDVSIPVDRPSKISKFDSHLEPMKKTTRLEYFNEKEHYTVLKSFRFMMARDPYQRLWSVYVDKFILLDTYFWKMFAPTILSLTGKHASTKNTFPCSNISFTDMLTYIVENGKSKPENLEPHIRPMHYGCNPCIYKPHFLGKVETLTKEKTPILRKLGLENLDDVYDFQSHVMNEMSMITDFVHTLYKIPNPFRKCLSEKQLEDRTLKAFIINGYLSEDVRESLSDQLPLGEMTFKKTVYEIFRNSSRTPEVVREQRERIRNEAFGAVPKNILYQVRDLFKFDFQLFGYDPMPSNIFS